jgi:hypothetical protein
MVKHTITYFNTSISPYAEIEQEGDSFLVFNLVTGLLFATFSNYDEAWAAAREIFHRYEAMEA